VEGGSSSPARPDITIKGVEEKEYEDWGAKVEKEEEEKEGEERWWERGRKGRRVVCFRYEEPPGLPAFTLLPPYLPSSFPLLLGRGRLQSRQLHRSSEWLHLRAGPGQEDDRRLGAAEDHPLQP